MYITYIHVLYIHCTVTLSTYRRELGGSLKEWPEDRRAAHDINTEQLNTAEEMSNFYVRKKNESWEQKYEKALDNYNNYNMRRH